MKKLALSHVWINTVISFTAFALASILFIIKIPVPALFILFLVFSISVVGLQLYSVYLNMRAQKYKESQKYVHETVHTIRNAYHYLELCASEEYSDIKFSEEEFEQYLTSAMTAAAKAFQLATNAKKCRTCIKVINSCEHGKELCIETLVRDEESQKKCSLVDERISNKPIAMEIDSTAYQIMSGKKNYYVSNNLAKSKEAKYFSELTHYDDRDHLKKNWPLPYISTIFSPIRYIPFRDEFSIETNPHQFKGDDMKMYYGFFSVDSNTTNIFYDTEHHMAAAIADALFPVLSLYSKVSADPDMEQKIINSLTT